VGARLPYCKRTPKRDGRQSRGRSVEEALLADEGFVRRQKPVRRRSRPDVTKDTVEALMGWATEGRAEAPCKVSAVESRRTVEEASGPCSAINPT